jgi:hypothetical protein
MDDNHKLNVENYRSLLYKSSRSVRHGSKHRKTLAPSTQKKVEGMLVGNRSAEYLKKGEQQ